MSIISVHLFAAAPAAKAKAFSDVCLNIGVSQSAALLSAVFFVVFLCIEYQFIYAP
jgi:hypothetical protein